MKRREWENFGRESLAIGNCNWKFKGKSQLRLRHTMHNVNGLPSDATHRAHKKTIKMVANGHLNFLGVLEHNNNLNTLNHNNWWKEKFKTLKQTNNWHKMCIQKVKIKC